MASHLPPTAAPHLAPATSCLTPLPAPRQTRSRLRQMSTVGLFAALMLLVTGCMRMDLAVMLYENDIASVQVDMAVQDEFISDLGEDPAAFWAEIEPEIVGNLPTAAHTEPYPEAGWTGTRISMADVPIAELSTLEDGGFTDVNIVREGNDYVFSSMSGMLEDFQDFSTASGEGLPAGTAQPHVTLTVTCPGPVLESNGTITGNTVVWDLLTFPSTEAQTARCSAIAESGGGAGGVHLGSTATANDWFSRWWPVLLGGVLLLALLGFLGYFLRRRSHQEQATASNFEHTADWGQPATELPAEPVRRARPYAAPRVEYVDDDDDVDEVDETMWDNDADY